MLQNMLCSLLPLRNKTIYLEATTSLTLGESGQAIDLLPKVHRRATQIHRPDAATRVHLAHLPGDCPSQGSQPLGCGQLSKLQAYAGRHA